jgi:hypothetical protein
MADSFKVTDGTTEIELIYAAGSQEDYKLQYGTRVSVPEPAVLVHQPDDGESQPIRAVDRDREVYLTMNVPGDNWDAVIDAVTRLKRMVDGAHSQALRYWTIGDVDRVVLRVQKDGSSRYTDLPVKWGFVDDSGAYHTSIQTEMGWQIVVMLVVAPYGEGAPIALRNDLASSPHFIEDSNSDGLADGWTIIGGSGALNTTYYLVGGQSQELTVTSSGAQYINSDTVTASTSSDGVGYIWICEPTGTADPVTIRLLNGSNGTISFETFDPSAPADYDKTATGAAGETWYRYSVTGNNGGTSGLRIQVIRGSGDASAAGTYYLDAAYLEVDQTVVPAAWCSTSSIENRYDPTSSDESRINYIDVWGVPGDSPGLLDQQLDHIASGVNIRRTTISQIASGKDPAGVKPYFIDSDNFSLSTTNGAASTPTTGDPIGGDFERFTASGGPSANTLTATISASDWLTLRNVPLRIFLIAQTSSTNTAFELSTSTFSSVDSGEVSGVGSTWEVVDLGLIIPSGADYFDLYGATFSNVSIVINFTPGTTSATVDFDGLYILPAESDRFIIGDMAGITSPYRAHVLGSKKDLYRRGSDVTEWIGGLWYVPAQTESRHVYLIAFQNNGFNVAQTIDAEFTITPRARHLLGVI